MNRPQSYLLGGVGILLVLLGTCRYGPAESADSAAYYSTAQHLVEGRGFRAYDDEPFTHWPPLIPLVLAGFGAVGIEPRLAFRWVNAAAFAGIVLTVHRSLRSRLDSKFLILVGTLGILFSYPLLRVSVYAFSEPLFVLFTLLCFRELLHSSKATLFPRAVRAGLAAGAAMCARYAGLVVIVIGAAHFLVFERNRFGRRLQAATVFVLVSCLPISLWWLRNYALAGSTIGERAASTYSWGENIGLLLDNVSQWMLPPQVPVSIRIGALVVLVGVIMTQGIRSVFRHRENSIWESPVWPWAGFVLLYSAFLVRATSTVRFGDPLNQRYAVPLFAPLLILFLEALQGFWCTTGRQGRRTAAAVLLVWLTYMAAGTGATVWHFGWRGGAYSSPEWRNSEGAAYLREHAPDGVLYSNHPAVVYLLTGRSARDLPSKVLQPDAATWKTRVVEEETRGRGAYVIWWKTFTRAHTYTLDELSPLVTLEPVVELKDATVMQVRN